MKKAMYFLLLLVSVQNLYAAPLEVVDCRASRNLVNGLEFTLTIQNSTDKTVEILDLDLPWTTWDGTKMVAVSINESAKPLTQTFYAEQPRADLKIKSKLLAPKEAISGKINISGRFSKIESAIKGNGFVVLWRINRGQSLYGDASLIGAITFRDSNPTCSILK